ncbi:MAG: hypothetical protein WD871_15430 [Xanthobacteraceae bacterium]
MKKIAYAALAAAFAVSVSAVPAAAQAGTGLGLIIHSSIVSKCQNRQLTQEEAQKTMWFPLTGIWQAMKDCRTASEKKK